jgi:hypothetical protein
MGNSRYRPLCLALRRAEVAITFCAEDAQERLPLFPTVATTAYVRFNFRQKIMQAGSGCDFLRQTLQLAVARLTIHFAVKVTHENMVDQFT